MTADFVAEFELLKPDGILIIEHGFDEKIILPKSLELLRKAVYGKTTEIEFIGLKGAEI